MLSFGAKLIYFWWDFFKAIFKHCQNDSFFVVTFQFQKSICYFCSFLLLEYKEFFSLTYFNAEKKPSRENVLKKTAASCFCQNENLIFCLDDHHFIIIIILEIFQRRCRQVGNKNKQSGLTTTAIYVTLPHSMIVSLRVF